MTTPDTGGKPKIRTSSWLLGSVLTVFFIAACIFTVAAITDPTGQAIATAFVFGSLCVTVAIQWRNEHQSHKQHQELKNLLSGAGAQTTSENIDSVDRPTS